MTVYRAAWVCPIDRPPIKDGWLAVEGGRIVGVGGPRDISGSPSTRLRAGREPFDSAQGGPGALPLRSGQVGNRDLGNVVLLPGLVNAHTHLELSWLRGRVPPAGSFIAWIAQLFAIRRSLERIDDPTVLAAAAEAAREARDTGTVAVGDISNSLASVEPIAASGLDGLVFHELIGFKERDGRLVDGSREVRAAAQARGVRVSIAPHAPYSVSPELFRAIRSAVNASDFPITSVHLGESPDEIEMLAQGTGAWPRLLQLVGAWRDDWTPPACGPVEYLDDMGILDERTLVVHGVQFDDPALERLARRGATVVTCPRSNQWVGVGVPPVERFYRSGVAVAVGTDSLASVDDLNLFSELKAMRWLAPGVPARELLKSATLVGASALGLDAELGSLTPGKRAAILAVALGGAVVDVEEYLVSGIEPRQIELMNL